MSPKVTSQDLQPLSALGNISAHDFTIRRKQILYKKDMDFSGLSYIRTEHLVKVCNCLTEL